jgi:hypothetical protein
MCYCILKNIERKILQKSMDFAKTVALEMNVEPIFLTKHRVITKKIFGENNEDHEHQ